jgi:AbiV family abortive infection protein
MSPRRSSRDRADRDGLWRRHQFGACPVQRRGRMWCTQLELLSGAGRQARAHSLAGLAVEEVGKAGSLATLAAMPENLRARAPLGRMLDWHQMKLVTGQLIAAVPFGAPGLAAKFVTTPLSEVAEILDNAQASAQDVDRLKQRGLYVDVDRSGQVREPSEVTADELREQLDRAGEPVSDPRAQRALYGDRAVASQQAIYKARDRIAAWRTCDDSPTAYLACRLSGPTPPSSRCTGEQHDDDSFSDHGCSS